MRTASIGRWPDRRAYIQRYRPYLPAAGEIVIFDRSWYNRLPKRQKAGDYREPDYPYKFVPDRR